MFGQFSGEEETDSGLDFPGGDGGPLVVVGKTGSLSSDALKDVIDKRVHDAHGLGGDTGVGVDLLQHLVDVDGIRLLPLLLLLLLVSLLDGLGGLARLLGGFTGNLGWHGDEMSCTVELTGGVGSAGYLSPLARLPVVASPRLESPAFSPSPGEGNLNFTVEAR